MGRSKKKRSKLNNSPPSCYPTLGAEVFEQLTKHDVCLGRGAMIVNLEGNANFRQVISAHRIEYTSSGSCTMKRAVAKKVVKKIESLDPPGRFYEILPDETLKTISFERALGKTMQALREKRGPALPPPSNQQDTELGCSALSAPVKKARLAKPKKYGKIRIKKVSEEARIYPTNSLPEEISTTLESPGIPSARHEGNETKENFDESKKLDDQSCMIDKTARAVAQGGRLQLIVESALAITTENPATFDEKFSLVPPALTVFVSGMYSSNNLDNMGSINNGHYSPFRGLSGVASKETVIQKMAGQQNHIDSVDMEDFDLLVNGHGSLLHHNEPTLPFAIRQPASKLGMDTLPFVEPPLLEAKNSLFLDDDDFNHSSYYPLVQNFDAEKALALQPPSGSHAAYHPSSGKTPSAIAQINKQTNWSDALLSAGTVMDVVEPPPELHHAKHSLFLDKLDDRQDSDTSKSIDMSIFEDTFSMNSFDGI